MPKIDCEAQNCTYNNNANCQRNSIGVLGEKAVHADETLCKSFKYLKGKHQFNSEIGTFANPSSAIWCEAHKCRHQNEGHCYAKKITIGSDFAFKNQETCCRTFEKNDK